MPHTALSTAGTPIPRLPTSVVGLVGAAATGPVDTPVAVSSAADFHAAFGPSLDADAPLGHAVDLFFANGGRRAVVVRAAGPAPEQLVPDAGPGGVHALDGEQVTVLAVPGLTAAHLAQVRVALARCAAYRAVLVLDLPPGPWTPATAAALEQIVEHRERAAAYHPWVMVGGVGVPPSGAVAGVIARTDGERGVWKAPAGVGVHGLDGLTQAVDARLSHALNQLGVNPLREFVGRGRQVWGARTLAAAEQTVDPARRYLNVRRLTDHILTSLAAGLAFVRHEQSDVALWRRVRQLTEEFLLELWRQGALAGGKTEQAYFTRCGPGETMTQAGVEAGVVVLEVGFAPVRSAEFDVHRLRWQAAVPSTGEPSTGEAAQVDEVVSSTGELAVAVGDMVAAPRDELAVDLDRVVSRYIGETEKNLRRLFDRAEKSGEVLLFDEADALFGRRTQIRDAHDTYANQELSYLIEKMGRERGVPVRWRRHPPRTS